MRLVRRDRVGAWLAIGCAAMLAGCATDGRAVEKPTRTGAPQKSTVPGRDFGGEVSIADGTPAGRVLAEQLAALEPHPNPDFQIWLGELRTEALNKGIRNSTLDAAFKNLRPIPRVIELDRNQLEFKLTYAEYLERVVPQSRIDKGRKMLAENRKLLDPIAAKYGVPPQYLVAFWGVETDFGRVTGGFPVIPALATLAHDSRRSLFFRKELLFALQIVDEGHVMPQKMIGSWAGAVGQCQFMPSSFVHYAVDADGDGRKDLWTDKVDVFASAANYLSQAGWKAHESWGRKVVLPKKLDHRLGVSERRSFRTWVALGVTDANGKPLPRTDETAALVIPDDATAFLVTDNYFTILKWNRSTFYALAVGQLADALAKR